MKTLQYCLLLWIFFGNWLWNSAQGSYSVHCVNYVSYLLYAFSLNLHIIKIGFENDEREVEINKQFLNSKPSYVEKN